jgi:CRP-like cAMP-binding protein
MVDISRMKNDQGVWEVTWKFEDESFETLQTIADKQLFKAGTTVFNEGDAADGMYLVLEGAAQVIRKTKAGETRTVAIVTEGQSFGEIGLLVDQPRRATVAAGTDLRVLKITRYALELLHKSAPDMAFMMYQVLARSLAEQLLLTTEMQSPE